MVLVGVQPSFTQVPPNLSRSITATFIPAPARRAASAGPAWPVPTTMASKWVVILASLVALPGRPLRRAKYFSGRKGSPGVRRLPARRPRGRSHILGRPTMKLVNLLSLPALALAGVILTGPAAPAFADGRELFITSAVEHPDDTATLPLYRGTSRGRTVWYILLDSSDGNEAQRRGINQSNKLGNARNTGAVQKVTVQNGVIEFPATVDFTFNHEVVPGDPLIANPGSRGEEGYSPFIQLPNGIILNAPQVANSLSAQLHDKVVEIDFANGKVRMRQTHGFQGGRGVKYISTDASAEDVAALEGSTFAPALALAPRAGDDSTNSARASL